MRGGRGRVLLAGLLTAALAAGATGAVLLREPSSADRAGPQEAVRTPLPAPLAAPDRGSLLPEAGEADDAAPSSAALSALVDAALADRALGGGLSVSVVDVAEREVLFERDTGALLIPASTAKIVTAVAALTSLDPQSRLQTRVLAGPEPGDVVLVGGGDTTLARDRDAVRSRHEARLDLLAAQVAARLGETPVNRVLVDDTLYTGPVIGPGWNPSYVGEGNVAPVMALMTDGGRVRPSGRARHADPALAAGEQLAALLRPGAPVLRGTAPPDAAELAAVEGPPITALVERMLSTSDNDLAEALARQVALAEGQPASFDGSARGLAASAARVLQPLGIGAEAVRLADGSGLSRDNLLAPGALTRLLASVSGGDARALSPVLTGLPVGGFDGTLDDRYREGPQVTGAGVVRAKTGTLRGVSSLAGVVRTSDGRLLAFSLAANAVPSGGTLGAERVLDRLAASIAACGCP